MIYKDSIKPFSEEIFKNPTAPYRATPFWAWNNLITEEEIDRQIDSFKEMGFGGFHVHVRTGLKNKYMDDDFVNLVAHCVKYAKQKNMLCWLYDEDRWSSGCAGGEVTKTVKYRMRQMKLTRNIDPEMHNVTHEEFIFRTENNEKLRGCFLTSYDLLFEDGEVKSVKQIGKDEPALHEKWYLYEQLEEESSWRNNETYVDTMNPEAIRCFIKTTHEKYYKAFGEEFGETVPAIFTDEPSYGRIRVPAFAEGGPDLVMPFTDRLPERYEKLSGLKFYDSVPYFLTYTGSEMKKEKYWYFETCTQLFSEGFSEQLSNWCSGHNIAFTGHMLSEQDLKSQGNVCGEAMRFYPYEQLPGIDMLVDRREFTTAKQCQSITHQFGREGVLSELYGVTQWDFTFEEYKLSGDWQQALGVTTQVPHLSWYSMAGEAKRDYPAAISYQSPWYKDYRYLMDHFARCSYILTRGKPVTKVGVLHPIETAWFYKGPEDKYNGLNTEIEDLFQNVTEWLLTSGIDFDFISEGVLESFSLGETVGTTKKAFRVGEMEYSVLLIPGLINIRKGTYDKILEFVKQGGACIFTGDIPSYVGLEKTDMDGLISLSKTVQPKKIPLVDALKEYREVEILNDAGERPPHFLYQLREEEDFRWLFIVEAFKNARERETNGWSIRSRFTPEKLRIYINGLWKPVLYDTLNGEITEVGFYTENGRTVILQNMYIDDSRMFKLLPLKEEVLRKEQESEAFAIKEKTAVIKAFRRTEPNVLLIDRMCYRFSENEDFSEETDGLVIDDICRDRFSYPRRGGRVEQPYVKGIPDTYRPEYIELKKIIKSETEKDNCFLALEDPEYAEIFFNGERLSGEVKGWYTDRAIKTISLPKIKKGENELILKVKYGYHAYIEWMYILGDFGVKLFGTEMLLCNEPEKLYFGDYVTQGYPFYTGNMEYTFELEADGESDYCVHVPYYGGVGVKLISPSEEEDYVTFIPRTEKLKGLKKGNNEFKLVLLGHRYNGFGPVHIIGNEAVYLGPTSWRLKGDAISETYQLKKMGLLAPVKIEKKRRTGKSLSVFLL